MPAKHYVVPNTTYFVTTNVRDHAQIFSDPALCLVLLDTLAWCQTNLDFALLAYAVMPDHLHLVIAPSEKTPLPDIIRRLKSFTGRSIAARLNRKGGIWQEGYYDHALRNASDIQKTIEYVHDNPVVAGLSATLEGYEFPSYRTYFGLSEHGPFIDKGWVNGTNRVIDPPDGAGAPSYVGSGTQKNG